MDQNKRELQRARWEELIESQEKSSLTQKEFCEQRQLILSQFVYYRGQLKGLKNKESMNTDGFVSIKLNRNETSVQGEIRLILPNGLQCYFPSHLDVLQIKRLIEALLSC